MLKTYFTTFTVTVASPGVFTATDHKLYEGDEIELETTGALPTGLTASDDVRTSYFVIRRGITTNTFLVSDVPKGDAIITTGTQSGVHSFRKVNHDKFTPLDIIFT